MTRKPKTKRFLGRTLTEQHGVWMSPPREFPTVFCGHPEGCDAYVLVATTALDRSIQVNAQTERAARAAMVRKLRRLRDELSKLEF